MSTKDKTREKLLNSMRKTKQVISDQPDSKQAHADTYATQAAPEAGKTTRAVNQAPITKSKQINKVHAAPTAHSGDPYQSRGRVWPD